MLRSEDRTFGFDTACTEAVPPCTSHVSFEFSGIDCQCQSPAQARKAIDSAYIEATTNANCIGLVKLMGDCPSFAICKSRVCLVGKCQSMRP